VVTEDIDLEGLFDGMGLLVVFVVGCSCGVGDDDYLILVYIPASLPRILEFMERDGTSGK
jgi:hypothetical protein